MDNKIQRLYRNKKPKELMKIDDIPGTCPKRKIKEWKISSNLKDFKDNIITRKPLEFPNYNYLFNKENDSYDFYNNIDKYISNHINNINKRHKEKVLIEYKNTRSNLFPETNRMLISGDYKKELKETRPNNILINSLKRFNRNKVESIKIEEPNFKNNDQRNNYLKNRNLFYGVDILNNLDDFKKNDISQKSLSKKKKSNNNYNFDKNIEYKEKEIISKNNNENIINSIKSKDNKLSDNISEKNINYKNSYRKEKENFIKNYDTLTEQLLKHNKTNTRNKSNILIN